MHSPEELGDLFSISVLLNIFFFLMTVARSSPPHIGSSPGEEYFLDRLNLFGSSCVALNCSLFRACGGAPQSSPGPVNGLQEVP